MPPNTIDVTRSSRWGNPFVVRPGVKAGSKHGACYIAVPTLEDAIECFRLMLTQKPEFVAEVREHLRGKNLACYCPLDQPCHANVLLELANAP
ncbi:DUF4326 domain-containing protein [Tundrisphaera lichenicola]|uniref:DUF4326 domain-containing protein n=1 Tax=Tundrisphaera lichenicola TaxID=2029860 RepID=UPI003EB7F405